jgi:hypothetical protein
MLNRAGRAAVLCAGGVFALAFALAIALLPSGRQAAAAQPFPEDLRATGLYSDFAAKTIDPRNLHYSPQYALWSDDAGKERWIYLPPGAAVDASDPDIWSFPAGTKVWKEFSFGGRRVETRLIESLGEGRLAFAAYAWNADGTEARLAPQKGLRNVVEVRPGAWHDIPGVWDCRACHVGDKEEILGFSALQLSPDRDPEAPHLEPVSAGMVDLATLIERKLVRDYPEDWASRPPRIAASPGDGRAALGYMHGNCGNCHNLSGPLEARGLILRHSVASGAPDEKAIIAGLGHPSHFPIPDAEPGTSFFLRPGDPEHSAIVYRMSTRNPLRQMPPLGTAIADDEALKLVRRWIETDLLPADARRARADFHGYVMKEEK